MLEADGSTTKREVVELLLHGYDVTGNREARDALVARIIGTNPNAIGKLTVSDAPPEARTMSGRVPEVVPGTRVLGPLGYGSVSTTTDRPIVPKEPPTIIYPIEAVEAGIEGDCEMTFDVDASGRPYNIRAACTDDMFKAEAIRATAAARFSPRIIRGQPAPRKDAVYPISFTLE